MTAPSTIIYGDLHATTPQKPSAVATSIARAAKDSLTPGKFEVVLRPLAVNDVRRIMGEFPSGHERLAPDSNLILLDASAMLAFAPYRSRILLTCDPFDLSEGICEALSMDINKLRIRLHDALLSAHSVVVLGQDAYDAVAPLLAREPEIRMFPAAPLRGSEATSTPILVINHEDQRAGDQRIELLAEAFPKERFVPFDSSDVFAQAWKAAIHFGVAGSSLPGARLADAWVGGVPVLQQVDAITLSAHSRHRPGGSRGLIVEHGKTGLLVPEIEDLMATLGDLLVDPLPVRVVARSAKRHIDPAAEWDVLLNAILQ